MAPDLSDERIKSLADSLGIVVVGDAVTTLCRAVWAAAQQTQGEAAGRCVAPPCKCERDSQRRVCAYWHATAQQTAVPDCGEAGHDEGRCGNASCSAGRPKLLTDEQRVDWLCEAAEYTCGQWQVVIESDKESFLDAVDEYALRAHGIGKESGDV